MREDAASSISIERAFEAPLPVDESVDVDEQEESAVLRRKDRLDEARSVSESAHREAIQRGQIFMQRED